MTTTLIKHQTSSNSKGHRLTGCFAFRAKLPKEVFKILGKEIKIRKHSTHYELSNFGTVQEGRPSILHSTGWLTFPNSTIEEYEDLGEYEIGFDFESEEIHLIKKQ